MNAPNGTINENNDIPFHYTSVDVQVRLCLHHTQLHLRLCLAQNLYSAAVSCDPTTGSGSSPSLASCIANRPKSMKKNFDTITTQSLFQYENGVSFGIGPSYHCPSCRSNRYFCKALTLEEKSCVHSVFSRLCLT